MNQKIFRSAITNQQSEIAALCVLCDLCGSVFRGFFAYALRSLIITCIDPAGECSVQLCPVASSAPNSHWPEDF